MKDFEKERQEIIRQKAEIVMKQIACSIAEQDLQEYRAAAKEVKGLGEAAELPLQLRQALEKDVCEAEKRDREAAGQEKRKWRMRGLARVAIIILACTLVGGVVLTITVDAFRIRLMDILLQDRGEYVDVNVVESGSISQEVLKLIPEDWEAMYYPEWLPEGYALAEVYGRKETGKTFEFYSENRGYLSINYTKEDTNIMLDSEASETMQTTVGRYEATCLIKGERSILVWVQDSYIFNIICERGSLDEILNVAESIVYVPFR